MMEADFTDERAIFFEFGIGDMERELESQSREIHGALSQIWRAQEALVDARSEPDEAGGLDDAVSEASAAVTVAMRALGRAVPKV